MPGTGDDMIRKAEEKAAATQRAAEAAGRAQAGPGHSQRLADARSEAAKAAEDLQKTRDRWG